MADKYEYEFLDSLPLVPASSAWVEIDHHYRLQGEEMYHLGLVPKWVGPYPSAVFRHVPSCSGHISCVTWSRHSGLAMFNNTYAVLKECEGLGRPCYSERFNVLGAERVLVSYRSRRHKFRLTLGYMQHGADRAYFQPILSIEVTPSDLTANHVLWPRMVQHNGRVIINTNGPQAIELLPNGVQWIDSSVLNHLI